LGQGRRGEVGGESLAQRGDRRESIAVEQRHGGRERILPGGGAQQGKLGGIHPFILALALTEC
jgi:hypothetical protein